MTDLKVDDFPLSYRRGMIRAYPVISGIPLNEEYAATPQERDAAFARILANRNLRIIHEMYLADREAGN